MRHFNDVDVDLFMGILKMADLYNKQVAEGLNKYNLSKPQFDILYIISRTGNERPTLSYLVKEFKLSKSNVSSILSRLETKNLVERIPDKIDKRVVWLCPTQKGKDFVDSFVDPHKSKIKEVMSHFGVDQKSDILTFIQEIHRKLIN